MANIKVPYALTPAVALDVRYEHMKSAIARKLPRLGRRQFDDAVALSIACYGPSLKDTWQDLRHPIISMSGATKFLAERGIVADYHIDMDPRANKVMTSLPPVPGVTYLVASVCCPEYFDALQAAGADVVLWHTVSSNWDADLKWVSQYDPGALVISSGSTIGLGAIQVGGLLGFRRFEIHGMDGSFVEGQRHAGVHHGRTQPENITWAAGGKTYGTSKIMANAVAETINTAKNFPIITVFHGEGLTQALIREANLDNACCADQMEKRARLAMLRPHVADIPPLPKRYRSAWEGFLSHLKSTDLPELVNHIAVCEPRRLLAKYNTGSVPFETAVLLRALCRFYQPETIAEIGTFIGTSTLAMVAKRAIYTCDRSNDCVPTDDHIVPHPYQSSTEMLRDVHEPVDFFFFDGRIQAEDVPEIVRLSHPRTVYAFDDYHGKEKGIANVDLLRTVRPEWSLIPPNPDYQGRSTLAVMVPAS